MGLITKIFGTYSDRELKQIYPIVDKIEAMEPEYQAMTDAQLTAKTAEFKDRLAKGETLDDILPEAFAAVREASVRVLGQRPYRVQLVGGVVLHQGRIAEMKTGEGKTLTAALPAYLNALTGKGVHIVTVNDYLAKRDSEWMGKVYRFLGLTVGLIVHGLDKAQRQAAYAADITYGTNNEMGFDYLRDNMALYSGELVQRGHNFAIVDEGDSKRALANISNLEATLANRRLTWKSGRSLQSLPLQALPTIISARVSSISCVPETIVLDVSPDSFNWSGWVDLLDVIHNHAEHRNCFVRYTEAHVGELHTALMNERKLAIKISHGELSEACTQALGIFFGMQAFLPQFFRFCAPAVAPIRLDDDEIRSWLFTLMKQTAEKTFIASLSSQFLYVARQHIRNGVLKLCTRMHASDATNVVYADDERLHFPASAFFSVCKAMHQTRPVILRALATDGLLCGAQTNPGTAQTRIHVYNEHGIAKKIAVYSFDRSAIEDLGDPLPLGEEGHDEP